MTNKKLLIDPNDVYSLFGENGMARLHVADIDAIPRVDAVEVVRCKDCKYWAENKHGCECSYHSQKESEDYPAFAVEMLPNDFCSYGERAYDERKAD